MYIFGFLINNQASNSVSPLYTLLDIKSENEIRLSISATYGKHF